jgi:DNA-binding HxlR family transcriptional regulator
VAIERKNAPAGNGRPDCDLQGGGHAGAELAGAELAGAELASAWQARPNPVAGCPLTAALAAFGGKWKLIIIYWLAESPVHFAGLRRLIPDISAKVLTEQLRELVADGIVARQPGSGVPDPVIYSLTEYGASVLPIVEATRRWGNSHLRRAHDTAIST